MNLKLSAQARLEILKFLAEGHSAIEACERWGVSLSTIKRLKRSVKPLISVNSRAELREAIVPTTTEDIESTEDTEDTEHTEFEVTCDNLNNFLSILKPRLVGKALDILNTGKPADQLKALDLLAKWTGLNLGNEERIQRQITEEIERRVKEELDPFLDAIEADTILQEATRDRICEIGRQLTEDLEERREETIDLSACVVVLPYMTE